MTSHMESLRRCVIYVIMISVFVGAPAVAGGLNDQCGGDGDCNGDLICVNSACNWCSSDSQCEGVMACVRKRDGTATCEVNSFFQDFGWRQILATIFTFVSAMLAAGGGVGGGGIFVPLFVLVLGMSAKQAIPLSQCTIFGGSLVNLIMNYPMRHPVQDKPLIDYRAILMLEPMLLVGTLVGVLLNQIFPPWLIVALLVITLIFASFRTGQKGFQIWKRESEVATGKSNRQDVVVRGDSDEWVKPVSDDYASKVLTQILAAEKRSLMEIVLIVALWALAIAFSIFRGGRSGTSVAGIKSCSGAFWGVSAGFIALLVVLTGVCAKWISSQTNRKRELGWKPIDGDIEWTHRASLLYPVFSLIAGIMGGLLGIGGGMVLGPMLIELGMNARSVSATSATAVFLTASSAAAQYLVLSQIIIDYSIWFAVASAIATFLGQTIINRLVQKYNRTSFIVISIGLIIATATVMMATSGIITVIDDAERGKSMGFSSVC